MGIGRRVKNFLKEFFRERAFLLEEIFLVTILETELKNGVHQAIKKAKECLVPVLVSEVQKIEMIEPLFFFSAGNDKFMGERFFWKDPEAQTILVGVGHTKQIQSDDATDRFYYTENEWRELIKESIILKEEDIQGTGPIMFGGYSFDPLKGKSSLWSKFPDSLFHVPKHLLTVLNGEAYLTTNILCTQHDELSLIEKLHEERQILINNAKLQPIIQQSRMVEIREVVEPEEWKQSVRDLVVGLREDELKKVVLARELRASFDKRISVESVLMQLLEEQKASFTFAFESNGDCFIGASPERLVKKEGRNLYSTCLAGSIARGKTKAEDDQLGNTLLNDEKNLIEHQYVVDMIKEAMENECHDILIPHKPELMKMRDIQHLYTPVVGIGKADSSLLQIVNSLHPTPALGGLPQREAVNKIREIEQLDRGFYAAPIGWLDFEGNGEFAVAIRSALIQGDEASLFAGCGIVEDSDAESEYVETKIKFRPMLSALGGLNNE